MSSKIFPTTTKIITIGSMNIDTIRRTARLPGPGETVIASSRREEFGGKGANQAVAAARQGARVMLVGALGNDDYAVKYREQLRAEDIGTDSLVTIDSIHTGAAQIYIDDRGENMIIVESGANDHLKPQHVEDALNTYLNKGDILLVQLECSVPVISCVLAAGNARGARVVFNASPVKESFHWGECEIDTVIVNEHECFGWFKQSPEELWEGSDSKRCDMLKKHLIDHLVVTRGKEATFHFHEEQKAALPGVCVCPVDSVGAGDTFAGALAAQMTEGRSWEDAILHANAAGALATLAPGAQSAMPLRHETVSALGRRN